MHQTDPLAAIKDATRLVLFDTGDAEFPISTYGGSMFLVAHRGRPYAVTAKHNLHDFHWSQMQITHLRCSDRSTGISAAYFARSPEQSAVGSDILDLAVLEFPDSVTNSFFEDTANELPYQLLSGSKKGDKLIVYGAPEEMTQISGSQIEAGFAHLECEDYGHHRNDPTLRHAIAQWVNIEIRNLAGLSGSPIYNASQERLAGMMVRGGLHEDGQANIYYVDAADIARFIDKISEGAKYDNYIKWIPRN